MDAAHLDPIVALKNNLFDYKLKRGTAEAKDLRKASLDLIMQHNLLGAYIFCCTIGFLDEDVQLTATLQGKIDEAVSQIDVLLANKTITELDKAQLEMKKIMCYLTAGMLKEATATFDGLHLALVAPDSVAACYFSFMRLAYLRNDKALYCKYLLACKNMLDKVDYDSKSNYRIYLSVGVIIGFLDLEGEDTEQYSLKVYTSSNGTALERHTVLVFVASLLRAAVPTYSSESLLSYDDFIVLALLINLVIVSKKEFSAIMQTSSDALHIVANTEHLTEAIECIQQCKYGSMNDTLLNIHSLCSRSFILRMFRGVVTRKYRIGMIKQLLKSYINARIPQMAATLNMPVETLQNEVEQLIVTKRLAYRIDQTTNVVTEVNVDNYESVCATFLSSAAHLTKKLDHIRKIVCE